MPKLTTRPEITSGLTLEGLLHLVNDGDSWKMKLSTLRNFFGAFAFPANPLLKGSAYVKARINNAGVATHDVYTVPTGKKAFVFGVGFFSNSGGTVYAAAHISSAYRRLIQNLVLSGPSAFSNVSINLTLNAGEKFAFVVTAGAVNCWASIVEFDDDVPVVRAYVSSLALGNNTVYTCPPGKTAFILPTAGVPSGAGGAVKYLNMSGGNRNAYLHLVDSGGSPTNNNRITATALVADLTLHNFSNLYGNLVEGDFLVLNTDSGAAEQSAYLNVFER